MLTHSFEDLAQTFRVLLESNLKFHALMPVDTAEAIGTLETAINAKLNAFHNLYDLMGKNEISPNWYEVPELCTVLAIRNARHHNKANRIRNLYNFHRYTAPSPTKPEKYFYVDFPAPPEEKGGDCFNVPLSWSDLDQFLSLPKRESHMWPKSAAAVREYLNFAAIEAESVRAGIPKERIFFNLVPLALNAGIALQEHVRPYVKADSTEASYFLHHFKTVCPALTKNHEYGTIELEFPK